LFDEFIERHRWFGIRWIHPGRIGFSARIAAKIVGSAFVDSLRRNVKNLFLLFGNEVFAGAQVVNPDLIAVANLSRFDA